jgi:hypothetical protein
LLDFGPGIPQCHGLIENQVIWGRFGVNAEEAFALELVMGAPGCSSQAGFNFDAG